MATASNLFIGWSGVTITPASGTAIPVGEVTDMGFGLDAQAEKFYGDTARFAKGMAMVHKERTCKITGGNPAALLAVPENTPCTIVATLNDYLNGVATGAITFTLTGAVIKSRNPNGSTNKFASMDAHFESLSADGILDPLSYVIAA